ncbi:hypothetical protein [Komagataeibacter sp. FNDCR2]|uniref:hypothetical protein n=1 Tax=Komagataeibacter sp. FNDCR2 TaxID=2878682 RepID=UPI001E3EB1EB|nr:hypothetical protein [Komagataeibacter sp. FNDCR2]MCE2574086.1 hypothetical protein [Komagataeibacter sp. FNDCR2]
MHFTQLAPIYQTLPIGWLRNFLLHGRAGDGLAIIGRAARSLAITLDPDAIIWDMVEPLSGTVERCFAALSPGGSDRLLVITDPDVAEAMLGAQDALIELCLRFRRGVMLPLVGADHFGLIATSGLAPMESSGTEMWRWIEGATGHAGLSVINTGLPMDTQLRFMPWFSAFAQSLLPDDTATLNYEINGLQTETAIRINEWLTLPLSIGHGITTIDISTTVPAGTMEGDARILSMAITSPTWLDDAGQILLDSVQFAEANFSMPIFQTREKLHRAGFYAVGGLLCTALTAPVPITLTLGDPFYGIRDNHAVTEPIIGSTEICWLTAGPIAMRSASC